MNQCLLFENQITVVIFIQRSFVPEVLIFSYTVDCIVLGRKLAQGFIPHWASIPEAEGACQMNHTPKVVFTKTLDEPAWENTVLAKGDLVGEMIKLKQQPGKNIIAYGGATFVSALIKEGLIDEYHLFVNPTAIGNEAVK